MMSKSGNLGFIGGRSSWPLCGPLFLLLVSVSAADSRKNDDSWKFDRIYLKSGKVLQGLIDREDENSIHFRYVVQKRGEPTLVWKTEIARSEIEKNGIKPLPDPKDREMLKARVDALDRATQRQQIEKLVLKPAPWGHELRGAWYYASSQFVLVSNASEEIVQQAAFRLEQIYAAYAHYLPPRHKAAQSTRVYLYATMADYQQELKRQGRAVLNPALYDPVRNEILCASDLKQLGKDLEEYRKELKELKDRLREQEAEWHKVHGETLPSKLREKLRADRDRIWRAEEVNNRIFEKATERLFQTLYHESFHSYLANFVYRPEEALVPRWLNEGLAQIFETAILEAGEARVGHADRVRLAQAQDTLKNGRLIAVEKLLRSAPDQFLVGHANEQALSDQYYLTSWAVAFYLTFGLDKLRSPEMTRYVEALKKGIDPVAAFAELVGQPPGEFDNAFHEYLRRLQK
jgi:hypothetical protein